MDLMLAIDGMQTSKLEWTEFRVKFGLRQAQVTQNNAHPNTMPTTTYATRRCTPLASLFAACLLQASPHALADDAAFFTAVAPGVVKDNRTGLQWMRCSLGQNWSESGRTCTGAVKKYTWQGAQAQDIAKKLNAMGGYGGQTGWRVPTVRELQSIRYCSKGFALITRDLQDGQSALPSRCADGHSSPTIDLAAFPATSSILYWSSTPYPGDSSVAWYVFFSNGVIGGSNGGNYAVRLVR